MKHTIGVLVENHFGVLARVAGLFSARGFNIDSLAVGETEDPAVSRMTIVSHGDDRVVDQIMKQLNKLIDVVKVVNLTQEDLIDRELLLVKVLAPASTRSEVMQIVNTFRAKIVDVNSKTLAIEVTGGESKIDAMLELLRPYGVLEVVRTGLVAMSRKFELSVAQKNPVLAASMEEAPKAKKKAAGSKKTKVKV
ncbi:MAG: acetolactate synthase small subunit [Candidatus Omnitrophica bacterium]|nr:acetolactate synthase small subunit [Candidatus Omnitrophota bacterium]